MAPKVSSGSNQSPGILGLPGLTVNVCRCPPGQGPNLHCHERTIETFMTLQGEFKCQWGDQGEHEITLGQFDMVSFPRNVMRRFENSDTQESLLLVLVQYGIQRLRMMPGLQKSSRHSVRQMSDSNLEDVKTAGNNAIGTQNAFSIGYTYGLSKRTNLYAVGTYMKNVAYISNSSA